MKFKPLHTNRLALRPLKESDADPIFFLRSSPEVNRYVDRPPTTELAQASTFINKISTAIAEGGSCYWAITEKGKDELIGTACIWNLTADGGTAEIGYELDPAHQGKGIMTEAIKAVLDFAFTEAGLSTLEAWTHKDNTASTRVLLKNGFILTDRKDPENENLLIFSISGK